MLRTADGSSASTSRTARDSLSGTSSHSACMDLAGTITSTATMQEPQQLPAWLCDSLLEARLQDVARFCELPLVSHGAA